MPDFKVKFDMKDYRDICPPEFISSYLQHDEIINYKEHEKGNIDNCIWQRRTTSAKELSSKQWKQREIKRILKTGVMAAIKDEILWVPPNYYFALQYGKALSNDIQFRLKRLKHVYFKIRARKNPGCKGTFTVKNRGDGETTMAVYDGFWETLDGNMNAGMIGIQSKTLKDAKIPCWMYMQTLWQSLPLWIKEELCSDFASGDNIEEKLKFMRSADEYNGIEARNIIVTYFPAVYNAMDGKHDMKRCILDEVLKWVECNFGDSYINYSNFIMPGFERKGLFDMFSSPADKDCKSYREGYELWLQSDTDKIDPELGTTPSRIHRYYSNPLEGIHGAYDKWGDADPEKIYAWIMADRKATQKDKLLEKVRGFPLDEEEMWGSLDGASVWSNHEGIKERKIYLIGHRFKDSKTKEPARLYGNLEWKDGVIDTDVEFRMSDHEHFDVHEARFCFSYIPDPKQKVKLLYDDNGKPIPPLIVENCIGVDPFNHRYPTKDSYKASDHGMVNRKFLDIMNTGIVKIPTMIYCCRPQHQDIAFEDTIKAAVFNRALIQYESRSDKFGNYAEDRGYHSWLLPEMGADKFSHRKGDSPTGKGAFLDEGMSLLDAATNLPIKPTDPYYLEKYWFPELLDDYLKFNPKHTQTSNLTMADLQALIGAVKLLHKKIRQPSDLNRAVLDYLFN